MTSVILGLFTVPKICCPPEYSICMCLIFQMYGFVIEGGYGEVSLVELGHKFMANNIQTKL